jgi:hypothetical protein
LNVDCWNVIIDYTVHTVDALLMVMVAVASTGRQDFLACLMNCNYVDDNLIVDVFFYSDRSLPMLPNRHHIMMLENINLFNTVQQYITVHS